jgi:hypothetical protein
MPHRRRLVPIRQTYSRDLKRRVIYQSTVLGRCPTSISIELDMPLRVVQRVIMTWKEIGEVSRERKGRGRAPMLSQSETKVSTYIVLLLSSNLLHSSI